MNHFSTHLKSNVPHVEKLTPIGFPSVALSLPVYQEAKGRQTSYGGVRLASASIKNAPRAYLQASPPTRQTIIEFDCRGLEFTEFQASGEWTAKGGETPTKFSAIDLQEGEWFDYDEKSGEEVSIKDLRWEIRRA
ncbi:MAG: hypothetical protein Q9220_001709 [cf. Caloplaca sp. 1 TL-2023]